jgi:choloylglycine hydrolase
MNHPIKSLTALLASVSLILTPIAQACTGISLYSDDGAVISGRTMEFGFDIQSQIGIVPAGTEIETLITDQDHSGFSYKTKYGFIAVNGVDKPIALDGLNEKGLYFGAHYFSGQAKFAKLSKDNQANAINSAELGNWLLGNFATVDEIRKALPKITVVESYIEELKGNAPLHYRLVDASGKSIVIEYTKAGLTIFDNKVNAFTNSPTFDWHLTNLVNYLGLTADNRDAFNLNGEQLAPFGEGTGLVGLPGDHSSPSRFVRATVFANSALPSKTADDAVFQAFHIFNTFDIPKGSTRSDEGDVMLTDYTIWTSVADTKNLNYYLKTYKGQSVEKFDLKQALKNITSVTYLPMDNDFNIIDRTPVP